MTKQSNEPTKRARKKDPAMNNTTKASYLLSERNRYLLEVVAMFKKEHRYPGRDANPGELDQAAAQFNARHREEISPKLEKAKQLTLEKVQEAQALFEKLENDLAILLQDKEEQIKADLSGWRDALSEAYDEAMDDFQLSSECLLEAPASDRPGPEDFLQAGRLLIDLAIVAAQLDELDQEEQVFYQLKKKAVMEG